MGSRSSSAADRRRSYASVCDVRKQWGLSCGGCVLNGFRECPVSDSKKSVAAYGEMHTVSSRVRGSLGYELHLARSIH